MFASDAALAILAGATWFTAVPDAANTDKQTVAVSYMTDLYNKEFDTSISRDKSLLDVAYQSKATSFYGLRYGASAMLSGQGTYMFGPGVGKTIDVKGLDLTLFIYPSFSQIKGNDRVRALSGDFNFRTTFDVSYRINPKMKMGVGLMHISNGGYKEPNHGLEALRFTLGYDY
jgi:hypothetical protein